MEIFVEASKRQYGHTFAMLRQAVELCPDELWDAPGDDPPLWAQMYHTILVTNGYAAPSLDFKTDDIALRVFGPLRSPEPGEPPFRPLIEATSKLMNADNETQGTLSREEILNLLTEAQENCNAALDADAGRTPDDPASNPYPWTGPTAYDKHMYNMRHLQHHLGRVNDFLRRRAGIGNPWVMEKVPAG